jgi:uncharacterized protein (DUF2147 family)
MRLLIVVLMLMIQYTTTLAQNPTADAIVGDWISPQKDLILRCYKQHNAYYGKVVWFKRYYDNSPTDPEALPEDKWLNTIVMDNFVYKNNEWADGEIYNLRNGKHYSAYITMQSIDKLEAVGFVFLRVFSETITFTKYTSVALPEFK